MSSNANMDVNKENKIDFSMKFDVEDHKDSIVERDYIKELMEEEEAKLHNFNSLDENDEYFGDEDFKKLLSDCGVPIKDDLSTLAKNEDDDNSSVFDFKLLTAKMTDISGDGLVFKRVVKKGEGFIVPDLALVIYHYKFYHERQREPFDTTVMKGRPDRQRVGVGQLLPGLDLALRSMTKKEKAMFVMDYSVMFGDMGVPPRIPMKADIYAEIEVVDYTEKNLIDDFFEKSADERLRYSFEDLIALVQQCRDDANTAFRNHRFAMALNKYLRGIDILYGMPVENDSDENIRWKHINKFHLNMALCNLKLNRGAAAVKCCNIVLPKDPYNPKALYRKGKGLIILGDYDEAAKYLKKAYKLSPNDKDIIKAMKENEDMKSQYYESERSLARLMIQEPEKKPAPKSNLPDLNCEIAKSFKEQLREFMNITDQKSLPKLKGLSTEESRILNALCKEYGLLFHEDDGIIIRKKK